MCDERRQRLAPGHPFCYLCSPDDNAERAQVSRPGRLAQSPRRLQTLAAPAFQAGQGVQVSFDHLDPRRGLGSHTRRTGPRDQRPVERLVEPRRSAVLRFDAARGRGRRSTGTSGASSGAGERRTSRSAANARSGIRLYTDMQSARACMTGLHRCAPLLEQIAARVRRLGLVPDQRASQRRSRSCRRLSNRSSRCP